MPITSAWSVPELAPAGGDAVVRLPELESVPLTSAVVKVIDHPHFQRLRRVRQLGPTHLVYPGALHTRFEHSIGVYGTAIHYLRSLLRLASVRLSLTEEDVRTVLLAALLHDVGHYPFAHSLEALHRVGRDTPRHEDLAAEIVAGRAPGLARTPRSLATIIRSDVGADPERVARLIRCKRSALEDPIDRLLQSVISSAIDADKMDYLWRDSVHLGVPYGRNYDRSRLLGSLTVNAAGDSIAVSAKGLISAEIFLFCRYTMFSEVYWHHTVRSASAMLEHAWSDIVRREDADYSDLTSRLLGVGDDELLATLSSEAPPGSPAQTLLAGLTGDRRRLYKRLVTWSRADDQEEDAEIYDRLYGLDDDATEALLARLRDRLSRFGRPLPVAALILDIPPRDKDTLPDVDVHYPRAHGGRGAYRSLVKSSRIVRGIGKDFISVVKKARLFVHPDYAADLAARQPAVTDIVLEEVMR